MKKPLIILAFAASILAMAACQTNNSTETGSKKESKKASEYYCTMHPSVTSYKPGTCPKCGMKLVRRGTVTKK